MNIQKTHAAMEIFPGETRIETPCPDCGREEGGQWVTPCSSDDCPSHDDMSAALGLAVE